MKRFIFGIMLALCIGLGNMINPSVSEAVGYHPPSYWCNNYNYPQVDSRYGDKFYVDLSSSYIANSFKDKYGDNYDIRYNIIIVNPNGVAESTISSRVLIELAEDGYNIYDWDKDNNEWKLNTGEYGYQKTSFNAGLVLLDKYFN